MRGLMNGVIFGAVMAFLFDPISGNRRRAMVRDKAIRYRNVVSDFGDRQVRDKMNRFEGLKHRIQPRIDEVRGRIQPMIDKGRAMIEERRSGGMDQGGMSPAI
jgi:gas vesicle protein